ncbi:hypothetical protein F5879DRAFT_927211 [Lentinula edodes]|nr:hypothetical protein F5879DRAFT_927211 [Lentinula edodes]
MFIRFCQNQKLRALLKGVDIQHLIPIATLYTDCFEDADNRGTRVADLLDYEIPSEPVVLDWESTSLPLLEKSSYTLLQKWIDQSDTPGTAFIRAKIVRRAKFRDMSFATQDSRAPNSQVVFNMSGRPWSAGSVQCIFVAGWENEKVQYTKTFVKIYPYKTLSNVDAADDNYHQTQALVLPLDAIAGHFGHSPQFHSGMQEKTIHVLPLNREMVLDAASVNVKLPLNNINYVDPQRGVALLLPLEIAGYKATSLAHDSKGLFQKFILVPTVPLLSPGCLPRAYPMIILSLSTCISRCECSREVFAGYSGKNSKLQIAAAQYDSRRLWTSITYSRFSPEAILFLDSQ